jgi:ABC-type multidrug transport system fused ATPase/permease subunit
MSDPNISELINELGENAKAYANTRIDYYKLLTAEKAAKASSWVITNFLLAIILALVLGFASLAGAIALGKALDNYPLALALTSIFYILLATFILLVRKKFIAEPLLRKFIKELFEEDKKNEKMNGHENHQNTAE